ncbi:ABC transporter ATP-binding protein [Aneurinibacillus sp. Ricciae_BoGa-3]|uniref:metal ABC transporter ATP-binding protein n=1 Tax=Aneurinibacillus sp. Ricciae_BoGa-3 TaxID=3022697 RepID=UPI0023415AD9|nr:ABC transporter ATP-binding protein [Aneurinibacillus sp. Ricciae_BoGa-3]WCK52777.1 ABC transporter ATP-binding protein [Aneurinibacillus sp. Ricciae_BoGa-3]
MGAIEVEDIGISFGGEWIIRNLSFSVKPGEFMGIIGPNGAGKTTLLRILLGIMQPQQGFVKVMGKTITSTGSPAIGYVPQSRQIDPETPLIARDFVSFGLPHRFRPWLTKKDRSLVSEALSLTDSEKYADKPIGKLSGGERQRLFLAQALLRNPKILFLDEPTSNLDPGAQEKMAAVVQKVNRERGISVVFVSHDIDLIARYAHEILYLTRGNYVKGTVEEVMQPEVLSQLYGAPVQITKSGSKMLVTSPNLIEPATPICVHPGVQ